MVFASGSPAGALICSRCAGWAMTAFPPEVREGIADVIRRVANATRQRMTCAAQLPARSA